MKKFDFRRQFKTMTLEGLKQMKDYHVDLMLSFIGLSEKDADRHSRYVSYLDAEIKKRKLIK